MSMTESIHYLDNAATTEVSPAAKKAALEALEVYGNPSSRHALGGEAKRLLEASRAEVALALGLRRLGGAELIFTASGSEANTLALLGFDAAKNRTGAGKSPLMLLTDGEHPSVENAAQVLESRGWKIKRIPTLNGELDLDELRKAVGTPCSCLLACFMLVNNETGALYDVKRATSVVRAAKPDAHVHCDAVQGFMKTKFSPTALGVNTLTVSAHKIHSMRGAAALYISAETVKKKDISPVIIGGGQEKGFRSGTEDLVAIAAFAAACKNERESFVQNREKVTALRAHLDERLKKYESLGVTVKNPALSTPDIANLTMPRIKSETMTSFLSARGVFTSAGSACSASSGRLSAALRAFGCTDDVIDSSLRISLSHTNTEADIDALCDALDEALETLVRF